MQILRTISIAGFISLAGCGGGSDSDSDSGTASPSAPEVQTGIFLDSPVINIGYRTATRTGQTNAEGQYQYLPGESVTFFIGQLEFPPVLASGVVTPLDLAGTRNTRDPEVVNMIRLLQSLDRDGNADNGINITESAKAAATPVNFALSEVGFAASSAVSTLIMQGGQDTAVTSLVPTEQAVAHLEESLTQAGQPHGQLLGAWKFGPEALLMFLPEGEYFAIQWKEQNNFVGFEKGTYEYQGSALNVRVSQNNDGEALLCNAEAGLTCEDKSYDAVVTGDVLSFDTGPDGVFNFDRQLLKPDGIVGIWEINGAIDTDGTLLVFLENGEYFGIEWGVEPSGFEQGTYSYDNGQLLISTSVNNDDDTLLCNVAASSNCTNQPYDITVSGDVLTIIDSETTGFSRRL
ncbi:hypothetical protein [Marinobacter sp.]|uniref:hypothetical protein n=1 Tax=Marinobacter sp. TaxID=50741 RepID=UPI00384E632C